MGAFLAVFLCLVDALNWLLLKILGFFIDSLRPLFLEKMMEDGEVPGLCPPWRVLPPRLTPSHWQQRWDLVMSFPGSPSGFLFVGLNLQRLWFCGLGERSRVRFPDLPLMRL